MTYPVFRIAYAALAFTFASLSVEAQTVIRTNKPRFDSKHCELTLSLEDFNACEQQRSVDIAEKALAASNEQTNINRNALYGLILTLLLTTISAVFSAISALAAMKQSKLSREALIIDQRAWIKTDLLIDGPLQGFSTGISIMVKVKIANIGKTPARNVHTQLEMLRFKGEHVDEIHALARKNRVVDLVNSRFLLPGEIYGRPWGPSIEGFDEESDFLIPIVIGCVTYQTLFDDKPHQTAFAYILSFDKDQLYPNSFFQARGFIPKDKISTVVATGGFAD